MILAHADQPPPVAVKDTICVAQVRLRGDGPRLGAGILTIESLIGEVGEVDRAVSDGKGTATRRYTIEGYDVVLGMIPSRTDQFCANCRRIRLAGDGQLRTCLFSRTGVSLRPRLRAGCTDDELARLMRNAVLNKPSCAVGTEVSMSQVGG